jgi:predicted kinase
VLLVVTGPPGAGKSTTARALAARLPRSAVVDGDAFFSFLARDRIDPWRPEADEQNEAVTRAAAAAAGRLAGDGFATVYDGVVLPAFLPAFAAATGLATLDYAVLLPPERECLRRVAARTGHGFTDAAATRRMHAAFAGGPVAARHLVADPGQVAALVLGAAARGNLAVP